MEKQPTVDASDGADPTKGDGKFRLAMSAVAKRMATIRFTPTVLSFHHGAVTTQVQLTQGEYPNYHQLIPTDLPNKVSFDAEEALRAIKSLAEVAAGNEGIVRLKWAGGRLVFAASADEAGSLTTSISGHTLDREGKIAFNIRYLTEYLERKKGLVLMETSTPSAPGRFFHSGSPDVLLMPIYVQWEGSPVGRRPADQPADEATPESQKSPPGDTPLDPEGALPPFDAEDVEFGPPATNGAEEPAPVTAKPRARARRSKSRTAS